MKKFILFTLIFGLLGTAVGCSKEEATDTVDETQTTGQVIHEEDGTEDEGPKEEPKNNVTPDVTVEEIKLADVKISKGEDNGNYISAKVTNNSKYKLTEVGFAYQSKNNEESVGAVFSIAELASASTVDVTGDGEIVEESVDDLMLMAMTYDIVYDDGKIINVSYSVADKTYEVFEK